MKKNPVPEVLPKNGLVYSEKSALEGLTCKPKLMPIKSMTLAQLEECERRANSCFKALGWGVPPPDATPLKPAKPFAVLPMPPEGTSQATSPSALASQGIINTNPTVSPMARIKQTMEDLQRQLDALEESSNNAQLAEHAEDLGLLNHYVPHPTDLGDSDEDVVDDQDDSSWVAPEAHPFCPQCRNGLEDREDLATSEVCDACTEQCEGAVGCQRCDFVLCTDCFGLASKLEPLVLYKWYRVTVAGVMV
uniref:Uncharacterized protein n=2 Tax=Eutreptiella gymnastica TaxID=73025 RepID=A0A7S1N526_9EUGL|mmetsp:Transcript_118167/g.205698  ORF Transcript_118167/g.205698 Transcript_118167/m.205698 type:complete len:249 (+) Transcript_118167:155-901(+)